MVLNIMENELFTVRFAAVSDINLLTDLGRQTFEQAFSRYNNPEDMAKYLAGAFYPEKQAAEFCHPGSLFLIAEENQIPAGYARLQAGTSGETCLTGDNPVELVRFYLLETWIGKGYGSVLMGTCLDAARERGYDSIWLGVWEKNDRAIRFYEKWGFSKVGVHSFLLGTDLQRDYIMERKL